MDYFKICGLGLLYIGERPRGNHFKDGQMTWVRQTLTLIKSF